MKRSFALMLALIAALALAACTQNDPISANASEPPAVTEAPTDAPEVTEAPTDAPAVTEAPTEAPSPEPTATPEPEPISAPIPTPGATEIPVELNPHEKGDFFAEIRHDVPFIADIDGDGEDDTGLVYTFSDEYYTHYYISVTRACKPDEPRIFEAGMGWGFLGAVLDFDPERPGLELMITYDQEDGDPLTWVLRIRDDGSDFDCFCEPIEAFDFITFYNGMDGDYVFEAKNGIPFGRRTEILGTSFVRNAFTVTKEGITPLSDEYFYSHGDYEFKLKLIRDMELTTESGRTVTARKGKTITVWSTDLETYVKIKLANGTIGSAKVTFGDPADRYPIYINGAEQDEYAEIPYAD